MRTALLLAFLAAAGCKSSAPGLLDSIDVADPAAADQLLDGFYDVEANAWRWTAASFRVRLKAPPSALKRGALLQMNLFVSDALIKQNHDTTLSCSADGVPTPPETFNSAGLKKLTRDLPPLTDDVPIIACTLSKPLMPGPVDQRELGIVVSKIKLSEK